MMIPLRIMAASEPYKLWGLRRGIDGVLEGSGIPAIARTDAGFLDQTPPPAQRVRAVLLKASSFLPTRVQTELVTELWRTLD